MQGHQFHPDSLTSQSTRSRLHLHCRNSCGKTISMIPFIIFVFFWIWQSWHVPLVAGEMVCSTIPTKPARSRIPWSRVDYKIFIQGFHHWFRTLVSLAIFRSASRKLRGKRTQRSCEAKQSKHLMKNLTAHSISARSNFLLQELHSWSSQDQCWCGESCFLASRALISRSGGFSKTSQSESRVYFWHLLQKSWALHCRFRLCGAPTGPSWTCFIVSLLEWRCLATPMETVLLPVATFYLWNVFPAGERGGMQFNLWRKAWRSVAEELFA